MRRPQLKSTFARATVPVAIGLVLFTLAVRYLPVFPEPRRRRS